MYARPAMSSRSLHTARLGVLAIVATVASFGCGRSAKGPGSTTTGPFAFDGSAGGTLTPAEYVAKLGVGLDVDWSKTGSGQDSYAPKMVTDFRARGLGHVRIRVKDAVSDSLLAGLDAQISDCLAAGLVPVLAYQADAFKTAPNADTQAAFVAWWRTMAEHFAAAPSALSFDLLIEPSDALNGDSAALNRAYAAAIAAIRATNPTRVVFLAPRVRSDPSNLSELELPAGDPQLAAEWHFYAAGPSKTNAAKQWTTGTPAEQKLVTDKIAAAKSWEASTGRATWVGAWMPGDYNDANAYSVSEQVTFATFMSCTLGAAHVPYAVNSDTKFYDRAGLAWFAELAPVVDAFVKPTCP